MAAKPGQWKKFTIKENSKKEFETILIQHVAGVAEITRKF